MMYLLALLIMAALFLAGYRIGQLRERMRSLPKRRASFFACDPTGWDDEMDLEEAREYRARCEEMAQDGRDMEETYELPLSETEGER